MQSEQSVLMLSQGVIPSIGVAIGQLVKVRKLDVGGSRPCVFRIGTSFLRTLLDNDCVAEAGTVWKI